MSRPEQGEVREILKLITRGLNLDISAEQFDAERFRLHCEGRVTRDARAYTYQDENSQTVFRARDTNGLEVEAVASYSDAQSLESAAYQDAFEQNQPFDLVAADESEPVGQRIEAIQAWLIESPAEASAFILDQLANPDCAQDLRDALVFLSEDARYSDEADRVLLAKALKRIAIELMESNAVAAEQVIWAAVRRYASLVRAEQAGEFLQFLEYRGRTDARLVALQGLLNVFEECPFPNKAFKPLCDRIFAIASKLSDADVLLPGESSAILDAAICALLAMADSRFEESVEKARSLNWPWLTTQIVRSLRELKQRWLENADEPACAQAVSRIDAVVNDGSC